MGIFSRNWIQSKSGIVIPTRIVKVFADECKGSHQNFQFWTFIWGSEEAYRNYETEIKQLTCDIALFPKNFKTFHASKSKMRSREQKQFRRLLEVFTRFVNKGSLSFLVSLESNEKVKSNSDFFFDFAKDKLLSDELFDPIPENVKTAIAHQLKPIYYLFFHRTIFGNVGDVFDYHPDAKSNYLTIRNNSYRFRTEGAEATISIQSIIDLVASSYLKAFESAGYVFPDTFQQSGLLKNLNQNIRSYRPMVDDECYTIQTADVIGNFIAASFGVELGSMDERSRIKRKIVRDTLHLETAISAALEDMELIEGRLHAKPTLRAGLFATAHPPSSAWRPILQVDESLDSIAAKRRSTCSPAYPQSESFDHSSKTSKWNAG